MSAITRSTSSEDELQMALNTNNVNKNKLLHGYEVLRILGKGNYGSVVLASRPPGAVQNGNDGEGDHGNEDGEEYFNKNLCVIKSVKHTRKRDGANVDAIKEVYVLKDLKHPCIVEYIDSFFNESETRLFIAMAYCDSGNLSDRIKNSIEKQQWIPEKQIVAWFAQLSLALAFIHEKKPSILHRDIKPENIFLTYGGTCVKLGDFGFTRTLANTMELALTRCGTPYYLSPEHCMNKAYNAKADVWAAGIVLYELLTLQVPFKGKTILELRNNILRAPLKRPAAHYSKDICSLLLQMLAREPEKRPKMRDVVRRPILQTFLRSFLAKYGYNNNNNLMSNGNNNNNNNNNNYNGNNSNNNCNNNIKKQIAIPEKGPFQPQRPPKGPSPTKPKRSISLQAAKTNDTRDATNMFIQQLEKERMSILSKMNNDRNKLISIRQKRPREKRGSSRLRREASEPIPSSSTQTQSTNNAIRNRTFVKPRGSPPRKTGKANINHLKLTPEKKLSALSTNEQFNNQSFVSNPSPQMKRMRSESPAMTSKVRFNYNVNDNENELVNSLNFLRNELAEKELKLHDARQSQHYDQNMRSMQNLFRSSLVLDIDEEIDNNNNNNIGNNNKYNELNNNNNNNDQNYFNNSYATAASIQINSKSRKSSSSNDYSDDFEHDDGNFDDDNVYQIKSKNIGNTLSDLEMDSDDDDESSLRNQVSELGKSVFQMTVDDDNYGDNDDEDNNIQSSGKFLMSGNSTLIHQGANPDNVLDTSVDRDLFHSLSSDHLDDGDGNDMFFDEGKMNDMDEDSYRNDNNRMNSNNNNTMQSSLTNLKNKHGNRRKKLPPPSPKARGNGINALRRLKQRENNRYGKK